MKIKENKIYKDKKLNQEYIIEKIKINTKTSESFVTYRIKQKNQVLTSPLNLFINRVKVA